MSAADERILTKKQKSFSYLIYNTVSLGKMAGKSEPFSSWRSVEDKLSVKYLKNLEVQIICSYFDWC